MLKRTSLFESHQALGARLVEFGGWEMPVHYSSILDEHKTVRTASGLFDIAHMGEVFVSGNGCAGFLNHLLTNNVEKLSPGQGQYTLLCNSHGGVIDDLYLYQLAVRQYLLILNASRIQEDVAWILRQHELWLDRDQVIIDNASDRLGAVALQGPASRGFIDCLVASGAVPSILGKNEIKQFEAAEGPVWIGCTGYTGEDGFEIIAPTEVLPEIWKRLLTAGAGHGIRACGLGARDTLRLEACFPLYGHELNETTSPIEAGLGFFVALDKISFIGRESLIRQKTEGVKRKCVAFLMAASAPPPRAHYPIWAVGQALNPVGEVTSGSQSPTLAKGIGLGYVASEFAAVGTRLEIEIRGRKFGAEVVKKPFVSKVSAADRTRSI